MDGGRQTRNSTSDSWSTDLFEYLKNMNSFENFGGQTSNDPGIHSLIRFVEVPEASNSRTTRVEGYSKSGLDLWVDLQIDNNPQSDEVDHRASLPEPIAPRQGSLPPQWHSSPPQWHVSDLGSPNVDGSNVDTEGVGDLLMPEAASLGADDEIGLMDLDHRAGLPEPVAPRQGSSPPQWQVSDFGSQNVVGSNVNPETASGLIIPTSLDAIDEIGRSPEPDLDDWGIPRLTPSPPQWPETLGLGGNIVNDAEFRGSDDLIRMPSAAASLSAYELNKLRIKELACEAMEELSLLGSTGEPLWTVDTPSSSNEVLIDAEYTKVAKVRVQSPEMLTQGRPVRPESSREIMRFKVKPLRIIELLMDVWQWSLALSGIVSNASIEQILARAEGQSSYDGSLLVMKAEFHAPTPFVPTRESHFARYCKRLGNSSWAVVDVSLEHIFPAPSKTYFRRRPSGCLVEDVGNNRCKVTWVEHVEVDNMLVHHLFQPLVSSGFAFGAKRWVNALLRHFGQSEAALSGHFSKVVTPPSERSFMLRLSGRLARSFFKDMSASAENKWLPLLPTASLGFDIRMSIKGNEVDLGKPFGSSILFVTSIHLPIPQIQVYNLLRNIEFRKKWDIFASNHTFEERFYITYGKDSKSCISKLRTFHEKTKQLETTLLLQESHIDTAGSYIVYAPLDFMYARNMVMHDKIPDHLPILSSGFSILPDRPLGWDQTGGGSLLTIAFNVLAGPPPCDNNFAPSNRHKLLIQTIMANAVTSIKQGLGIAL